MKNLFIIIPLAVLLLASSIAHAAPPAPAVCTVSTTSVNFGAYDVFFGSPNDSTGSVTISCDKTIGVTTAIGSSPNSGGFNPRKLIHDTYTEYLNYNLYTDSARTSIWGDGTSGTVTQTKTVVKNKPEVITVYGRIPALQSVSWGTYSENLTVTINW